MLACGCAATYYCRYPPVRWLKDSDRAPVSLKELHKSDTSAIEDNRNIVGQMKTLINFSQQLSELTVAPARGHEAALNVNNFDEVADSTWFTNRIGRSGTIDLKEDTATAKKPLTIFEADIGNKDQTLFITKDSTDKLLIIEIDTPDRKEMITGAQFIASRILHAAGYNTFKASMTTLSTGDFLIDKGAKINTRDGKSSPFDRNDLKKVFKAGSSLAIIVEPPSEHFLGPFSFRGKLRGDINDRIPHEHRRELRAFRIFAAFLNLADAGGSNAMDMFIPTGDGKGYVEHHMVNFTSALDNTDMKDTSLKEKNEYQRAISSLFSFGFYDPYWTENKTPSHESSGPFDAANFDPAKWRAIHPNAAFKEMTPRDAFWAAKILLRFSDKDIANIVNGARYSDPKHKKYLIDNLIARRDKTCRYWFGRLNPMDNFELRKKGDGYLLTYDDLAVNAGFEDASKTRYGSILKAVDGSWDFTKWQEGTVPSVIIDAKTLETMPENKIYTLQVRSKHEKDTWWSPSVDVFIKKDGDIGIFGIKREHDQ